MKENTNIKVFGISGLGADKRIFDYLNLDYEFIPLDWIVPKSKETIQQYAQRMIDHYKIDKELNVVILGVSFGGMIASEMNSILNPTKTFVISSATKSSELPWLFSIAGKLKLIHLIPKKLLKPNVRIAAFLFGTKKKKLLKAIIDDTDLDFLKWGIYAITNWKKTESDSKIITLHGTKDKVIPSKGQKNHLLHNGGHFMIVDMTDKVSAIINKEIQLLN